MSLSTAAAPVASAMLPADDSLGLQPLERQQCDDRPSDYDVIVLSILDKYLPTVDRCGLSLRGRSVASYRWAWLPTEQHALRAQSSAIRQVPDVATLTRQWAPNAAAVADAREGALTQFRKQAADNAPRSAIDLLRALCSLVEAGLGSNDRARVVEAVNVSFGSHTMLTLAAANGDIEAMDYLMNLGANPNAFGFRGRTLLTTLAANRHYTAFVYVIQRYAFAAASAQQRVDVSLVDSSGKAALETLVHANLAAIHERHAESSCETTEYHHRLLLDSTRFDRDDQWRPVFDAYLVGARAAEFQRRRDELASRSAGRGDADLPSKRKRREVVDDAEAAPLLVPAFVVGGDAES